VLNKSILATGTRAPVLAARVAGERSQMERMSSGLTKRCYVQHWLDPPTD